MLEQPLGSYDCAVEEVREGEYSKCTVVIRKRDINDDIIDKQTFLIQRLKQDNSLLKRVLETRTTEMTRVKNHIDQLQLDNLQLNAQVISLSKNNYAHVEAHNARLQMENEDLKIQIEHHLNEIAYQAELKKTETDRLLLEMQNLQNENDFLRDLNNNMQNEKHFEKKEYSPNKHMQKLEKKCRELEAELDRERRVNDNIKKDLQNKLNTSQPIKISSEGILKDIEGISYDFARGSVDLGPIKRVPRDEFEISAVRSRGDSDLLLHESYCSVESNDASKDRSLTYQKSEAEIQTERCEIYEPMLVSREKIEKSLNQRRNNHMKPMDQHTRIMHLSKQLNEKEQTIKQLEKKFEKEKKNSESVKSKLKQKEKELKKIKKDKSLKREIILIEDEPERTRGDEERRQRQEREETANRIKQLKEETLELQSEIQREKEDVYRLEQAAKKDEMLIEESPNIVQIEEEVRLQEVVMQTEEKYEQPNIDLKVQNQKLLTEIEQLKQKITVLSTSTKVEKAEVEKEKQTDVIQADYPDHELNIRVSVKHDEQSDIIPQDELTQLRRQVVELRYKLKEIEYNEDIPLHVTQEVELKEVNIQTEKRVSDGPSELPLEEKSKETYSNPFEDFISRVIAQDKEKNQKIQETVEQKIEDTKEIQQENLLDQVEPKVELIEIHNEKNDKIEYVEANQSLLEENRENENILDDDHLHINIVEKHDEDSMVTPEDELTLLREEVLRLRAVIRELRDNEPIPFEAVEEELEFREVVTQTDRNSAMSEPAETHSQQKALSDMIARVIAQSRNEEAAAKQSAVEAIEREESGNFFADLMANMLGTGREGEGKEETTVSAGETTEKQEQNIGEKKVAEEITEKVEEITEKAEQSIEEKKKEEITEKAEQKVEVAETTDKTEQNLEKKENGEETTEKKEQNLEATEKAEIVADQHEQNVEEKMRVETVPEKSEKNIEEKQKAEEETTEKAELNVEATKKVEETTEKPKQNIEEKPEITDKEDEQKKQKEVSQQKVDPSSPLQLKVAAEDQSEPQIIILSAGQQNLQIIAQQKIELISLEDQVILLKNESQQLKEENEQLKHRLDIVEQLLEEEQQLRISDKQGEPQVVEVAYPEDDLKINCLIRHDEDSMVFPQDEIASLRLEVQQLRAQLKDKFKDNKHQNILREKQNEIHQQKEEFKEEVISNQQLTEVVIQTEEAKQLFTDFEPTYKEQVEEQIVLNEVASNTEQINHQVIQNQMDNVLEIPTRNDNLIQTPNNQKFVDRTYELIIEINKLREENADLKWKLDHTQDLVELQQKKRISQKEGVPEVVEQAYPEEAMNIKLIMKHDEDSLLAPQEQIISLKKELKEVKERLNAIAKHNEALELKEEQVVFGLIESKPEQIDVLTAENREAIVQTQQEKRISEEEGVIMSEVAANTEEINEEIVETSEEFKEVQIQAAPEGFKNLEKVETDNKDIRKSHEDLLDLVNENFNLNSGNYQPTRSINNQDTPVQRFETLDNELGSQNYNNFQDVVNGRRRDDMSNNSIRYGEDILNNNNEKTLLYTIQEELSEWKNKYELLLREKEAVEEALNKERSLYIPLDMHPRYVRYEAELQISLDSGNPLEHPQQVLDDHKEREEATIKPIKQENYLLEEGRYDEKLKQLEVENQRLREEINQLKKIEVAQMNVQTPHEDNLEKELVAVVQVEKGSHEEVQQIVLNEVAANTDAVVEINVDSSIDSNPIRNHPQRESKIEDLEQMINILRAENEQLFDTIKGLQQKIYSLQTDQAQSRSVPADRQVEEVDYPGADMKLRVSVQHDSDSEILPEDENAILRREIQELRARLRDTVQDKTIPLDQEPIVMKEVIIQTECHNDSKKHEVQHETVVNKQQDEEILNIEEEVILNEVAANTQEIQKVVSNELSQEESSNNNQQQIEQSSKTQVQPQGHFELTQSEVKPFVEPEISELQKLKLEIGNLKQQNYVLRKIAHAESKQDYSIECKVVDPDIIEQIYPDDELSINVLVKHDTDSYIEQSAPIDDVVVNLKKEVEGLKEKLRETVDNEIIPLQVDEKEVEIEKKERKYSSQKEQNYVQTEQLNQFALENAESQEKQEKYKENTENEETVEFKIKYKLQSVAVHQDILIDDEHLHINIVEKHDEDSMVTPEDELTLLREEVLRLRAVIRELRDNEPIPFEAVEEELEFREVVTQTDRNSAMSEPAETHSQQKALSDMIARVIAQSRNEEAAAKQSAVEAIEREESGNFLADLMANMLGTGGESGEGEEGEGKDETVEKAGETTEKQEQKLEEKKNAEETIEKVEEITEKAEYSMEEKEKEETTVRPEQKVEAAETTEKAEQNLEEKENVEETTEKKEQKVEAKEKTEAVPEQHEQNVEEQLIVETVPEKSEKNIEEKQNAEEETTEKAELNLEAKEKVEETTGKPEQNIEEKPELKDKEQEIKNEVTEQKDTITEQAIVSDEVQRPIISAEVQQNNQIQRPQDQHINQIPVQPAEKLSSEEVISQQQYLSSVLPQTEHAIQPEIEPLEHSGREKNSKQIGQEIQSVQKIEQKVEEVEEVLLSEVAANTDAINEEIIESEHKEVQIQANLPISEPAEQQINLLEDDFLPSQAHQLPLSSESQSPMKPKGSNFDSEIIFKYENLARQMESLKDQNKYLHELLSLMRSNQSSCDAQENNKDLIMTFNLKNGNPSQGRGSSAPLKESVSSDKVLNSVSNLPDMDIEVASSQNMGLPHLNRLKNLADSIQTPRFDSSSNPLNLYGSDNEKFFSNLGVNQTQVVEKLNDELAMQKEQIVSLNTKLEWIEEKLKKSRKQLKKYRQERGQTEEIEIEEEEMMLIEVETQTNPYMFSTSENNMEDFCEELEYKLEQQQRNNLALKTKLKRWQNIMRKIHSGNFTEEEMQEDFEELEIEEENIQLCQVQIQVNFNGLSEIDEKPEEDNNVREKMKQTSKLFLNEIENLKQKWIGEDSQENESENCSDRGKNTKRSFGSDQDDKIKKEKLLELELSHLYKDIKSTFKKYHYKNEEDIKVDSLKDELQRFVTFIRRENLLQDAKYNSFEDIKEQSNDDSCNEREKLSGHKIQSEPLIADSYQQPCLQVETVNKPEQHTQNRASQLQILFIEHQSVITQSQASFEINPLMITEVVYSNISKQDINAAVLKLIVLSSDQIRSFVNRISQHMDELKEKLDSQQEIDEKLIEEIVKVYGVENIDRLLALQNE